MNRRAFIAATVGTGLATTTGCLAGATPGPPDVPDEKINEGGWALVDEGTEEVFSDDFAGHEITATASTEIYDNERLADRLDEQTLGQVNGQLASFFASRVTFDPDLTNLPGGVGREEVVDRVEAESRETLREQLAEAGIEDVERVEEGTLTVDTGDEARRTDVEGLFPFGPIEFPVSEDVSIELEGDELEITGHLAVWHHEDSVLVAGGAYPAESYEETISRELSSAIDVTVEVDLELDPDAYEAALFDLVTSTK